MSYDKLKGEAKLDYKKLDNGETEYSVYDDNCFICGTLGCNKGKLKEMIQRSNEHRELKEKVERSCAICGVVDDLKKESKKLKEENKELWEIAEEFRDISKQELDKNDKLSARNRELAERRTPKKVKEHYNWCDFTEEEKLENHHWFCENCTAPVEEHHNYCPECGQKLDWRVE